MCFFDVPREPLVLGLVLGTMAESELARALALVGGNVPELLQGIAVSPICLVMIALTLWTGIRSLHGLTKMERPFSLNGTLLFEYGTIRHPEVLLKRNDHRTKSEHRSLKTERA